MPRFGRQEVSIFTDQIDNVIKDLEKRTGAKINLYHATAKADQPTNNPADLVLRECDLYFRKDGHLHLASVSLTDCNINNRKPQYRVKVDKTKNRCGAEITGRGLSIGRPIAMTIEEANTIKEDAGFTSIYTSVTVEGTNRIIGPRGRKYCFTFKDGYIVCYVEIGTKKARQFSFF